MKTFLIFLNAIILGLTLVSGFRRCVIPDYDCTLNSTICARGPFGRCRTFQNPCLMETENCYRFLPFTQTVLTACNGLANNTLGICAN